MLAYMNDSHAGFITLSLQSCSGLEINDGVIVVLGDEMDDCHLVLGCEWNKKALAAVARDV